MNHVSKIIIIIIIKRDKSQKKKKRRWTGRGERVGERYFYFYFYFYFSSLRFFFRSMEIGS